MTTYFITGGFGFLGQYIVQALHEYDPDAELRVLGRTQRSTFLGVEKLPQVRWIEGNLSNPESFREALKDVDAIIHNAAMVSFRRLDADVIFQANVIGTRNLAQVAVEAGCENFIFISSISAIGSNPKGLIDESCYPDMAAKRENDMYGFSKRTSELELAALTDKMRIVTLNPSVILGPGSARIEDVFKALRWLPVLPMFSYVNSFVDVRDVARAVVLALTKGRSGERYIVTAHNLDMLVFTRQARDILGKKSLLLPIKGAGLKILDALVSGMDLLHLNPGIRRPSEMVVDKAFSAEKIKEEMGWAPQFSLEESIQDAVDGALARR